MKRRPQLRTLAVALLGVLAALALVAKAQAHDGGHDRHDRNDRHADGRGHAPIGHARPAFRAFHEHDVRRLGGLELAHWRAGNWHHRCYEGRCGWWWFTEGQWFYYDRPGYPYPAMVSEIGLMAPLPPVMPAVPAGAVLGPRLVPLPGVPNRYY